MHINTTPLTIVKSVLARAIQLLVELNLMTTTRRHYFGINYGTRFLVPGKKLLYLRKSIILST
jgi:hypothetical protein